MYKIIYILFMLFVNSAQATTAEQISWYEKDINNKPIIHLYFFWSKKCSHCLEAQPDILKMQEDFSWLKLHSMELIDYPENITKFSAMASLFNNDARSVPTFMFCNTLTSGYESQQTTGKTLREQLHACYQHTLKNDPGNQSDFTIDSIESDTIELPILGKISFKDYSLPVLTVFIAAMDAFNPCAFFILLFLLSMIIHAQKRSKILIIGCTFVFFSGLIYFAFMAAWLNLFIYLGELRIITIIAGIIATSMALINIKDYFWFKKGLSLSIPDEAKPRLFDRMRNLIRVDSMLTVILATIVLALVANSYEILCTAGFPMIYTRILTLNSLSTNSYYLYLLLYNFIYILPLLFIVILFTIKLGARKLSQQEGMLLKLLSGTMMLLLGLVLLTSPELLNNIMTTFSLLLISVIITWLINKYTKKVKQ